KYYLNKIGLIKNYTMYTIGNKEDRKNSLGMDNPIINSIKSINRNITRKIKIRHLNNFKNKYFDKVEEGESFALYPLHFQPESSTSVNAMYFVNQYEVIKNVAFSMPIGMKLYVKDHPHAFGYFSLDFYKKIKRIPNVKLIHCDENVNLLVNKMKFLVTLTGTMGYEALLQKKPILSFGKISYNVHPYCFNISRYEDIFDTIKKILKSNYDKFDEYNKRLIYAYKNNVYNGILVMYDYTKSSMDLIAENLINILQDGEKNV
ncbi:MAG: capsular biosynthesis protein, partial [Clostridium sp.]|nr:capsular biosynthesis protein [Clostridium sp.]